MYRMKRYKYLSAICLVAAALFSACSQDELAERGAALPDGAYPITFSAIQVTEASPQTRVSDYDDTDGTHKSRWTEGDKIKVTVTPQSGTAMTTTCTLDASGNITDYAPQLYWQNTSSATISAWYSNIRGQNTSDNTVSLADQSGGLVYVLKADDLIGVNYQSTSLSLTFKHQLAKIRVKLDGEKAADVTSVSVKSNTGCTVSNGDVTGSGEGFIPMHRATYGDKTYWEANVVPGKEIKDFQLNGTLDCSLATSFTPSMATVYEVTINAKSSAVEDGAEITESGTYTMSGTYTQGVTINGDGITLILEDAKVETATGAGITIKNGTITIEVSGSNTITSGNSTGIALDGANAHVEIKGTNKDTDILEVTGASTGDNTSQPKAGAGIGSLVNGTCGNITISNVTVKATGGTAKYYNLYNGGGGAAIGSASEGNCGNITITDAIVEATGGYKSPAIGLGDFSYTSSSSPTFNIGTITISNCTITATGGQNASVIGFPYVESIKRTIINAGKITICTSDNDYLSKLQLGSYSLSGQYQAPYKIGKGVHVPANVTFNWTDGVEVYINDVLSASSTDGVGQ